jgi:hypothetical protein
MEGETGCKEKLPSRLSYPEPEESGCNSAGQIRTAQNSEEYVHKWQLQVYVGQDNSSLARAVNARAMQVDRENITAI